MSEEQDPTLPQSPPLPGTSEQEPTSVPDADQAGLPLPAPAESTVPQEPQPDAGTPTPYPQSGRSGDWVIAGG